jgi:peptidoglycan/LPS O-acetylase OafA/YrhL
VEEQFYLALPLAALAVAHLRARAWAWWLLLAAGVAVAVAVRCHAWQEHGQLAITGQAYYQHVYYNTFARFDELLAGLAIAVLKVWHPRAYATVLGWGNRLLVAGLAATAAMWWWLDTRLEVDGLGYPLAPTAIGYPLLALAYALLVLAALSPGSLLNRVRVPGAQRVALWSYSIYLAHKPLSLLMVAPVRTLGIDPRAAAGVALIMTVSVLAGWLLYRAVELPFLRLRERWLGHGAAGVAQAA